MRHTATLLICATLTLAACGGSTEDDADNRVYIYGNGDPFAPGAVVVLGVDDSCGTAGGKAPNACLNDTIVAVTEGTSSAPELVEVVRSSTSGVTVRALAPGQATISAKVETRDTIGRTHHERVSLTVTVEAPERMRLLTSCSRWEGYGDMRSPQVVLGATYTPLTATQAAFVAGQRYELEVSAQRGDRAQVLTGVPQEALFTLTGDPASASVEDISEETEHASTTRRFAVTMPETPSNLTLRAGFGDAVQTFRAASPEQIDGVQVSTTGDRVAPSQQLLLQGTVAGTPLCSASAFARMVTVRSSTPEVCAPVPLGEGPQELQIEALATGTCKMTVRIGERELPLEFEVASGS